MLREEEQGRHEVVLPTSRDTYRFTGGRNENPIEVNGGKKKGKQVTKESSQASKQYGESSRTRPAKTTLGISLITQIG